jgi:hypothetical protein
MENHNVPWKEIGECKHRIRHSLTKAIQLEVMAKQLRLEVKEELDNMDEIINKLGEKNETSTNLINCPMCDCIVPANSIRGV